jgi:hypothetical protein
MSMKLLKVALLVSVLLTAFDAAQAQSGRIKAEIPFDFTAGDSEFSAGTYTIVPMSGGIRIRDTEGTSLILSAFAAFDNKQTSNGRLSFVRYGDRYFLQKIFWGTGSTGRELMKSNLENQLGRNAPQRDRVLTTSGK